MTVSDPDEKPMPNDAGQQTPPDAPRAEPPMPPDLDPALTGLLGEEEEGAASEHSIDEILAAFAAERDQYRDRMLRGAAELDNLRKRTEKEKADVKKYAVSEFARDVLSLGDNIKRAMEAVPADAAGNDPALKSFLEGVQLLERDLLAMLERHGVVRFTPMGERADPNKHQAVMQVPDESVPNGTVVQVFQDGYMIHDRVLRAAMVAVSSGGPKVPRPAEGEVPPAAAAAASEEDGAPEESGRADTPGGASG